MANELTWHDVLAEEKQQPYFLNTQKMSLTRSALPSWVTLKW